MEVIETMMNTMNTTSRSYSELILLPTFIERFKYLKLSGKVGVNTFGDERYLNQKFYMSNEWRTFRQNIIVRDKGCDLGISDREITGKIILHHINPLTRDDIIQANTNALLNPENVICVSNNTHQAIHYGDESLLILEPIIRTKNDTCPWR